MMFEKMSIILNLIVVVAAPIMAVVVGQYLQNKKSKRDDKMAVFKTLMASRGIKNTRESVEAINLIPVVFAGEDDVIKQWKSFYDSTNTSDRSEKAADKMAKEKIKLLESIAKLLGYDKNINWETLVDSYYPENLAEESRQNEQMRLATLSLVHHMQNNVNKNINKNEKI